MSESRNRVYVEDRVRRRFVDPEGKVHNIHVVYYMGAENVDCTQIRSYSPHLFARDILKISGDDTALISRLFFRKMIIDTKLGIAYATYDKKLMRLCKDNAFALKIPFVPVGGTVEKTTTVIPVPKIKIVHRTYRVTCNSVPVGTFSARSLCERLRVPDDVLACVEAAKKAGTAYQYKGYQISIL